MDSKSISQQQIERINLLEAIATGLLILSIIGAIAIWITMGTHEVSTRFGTYTETNPVGVAMGIVALGQGIVIWGFLRVYCDMAKNLLSICSNLGNHPIGQKTQEIDYENLPSLE